MFDVLSKNTKITGNRFLEASAGTGKTFAIEHVVTRLLLETSLTIDQILVVTFTRAAARELKRRIRATLENALLNSTPWGYLLQEGLDRRRLSEALVCFDRAQIFTIHGFCHRMLGEYALEARLPFSTDLFDEERARRERKQTILDALRTVKELSPHQLEILLKEYTLEKIVEQVTLLLEEKKPLLSFSEIPVLKAIERYFVDPEKLETDVRLLAPCYKRMGSENPRQFSAFAALFKDPEKSVLDSLLSFGFLEKIALENRKVRAKIPQTFYELSFIEELCSSLSSLIQEAKDPRRMLHLLAKQCKEKWDTLPLSPSPQRLLVTMAESVRLPEFLRKVRSKVRAVIIDEFQDTDSIQWEIFQRLFLQEDAKMEAVYLVGDPKQSIYSFRSADIYTYLKAREWLGDGARAHLEVNYRSSPALLKQLNRLFSHSWLELPKAKTTLEYRSVHPRQGAEDSPFSQGKETLQFFLVECEPGREKTFPSPRIEEEFLFPFIAEEIVKTNRELCSYAILVKDRYQARRLQAFLHRYHIPSSLKSSINIAKTKAFSAFRALFKAIAHPEDMSICKIALSSLLFGLNYEEIEQEELFSFAPYKERFLQEGFSRCLEKLLPHFTVQEDSSFYFDFRHLIQIFLEKEAKEPLTFEALFSDLTSLEEQEETVKDRGDAEDQVILMTMHMSKGLEFEVVFALGLASRHLAEEEDPLLLQELDAEKMRHLYVALTRAKKRVYVPCVIETSPSPLPCGAAAPIELFLARLMQKETLTLASVKAQLEALSMSYVVVPPGIRITPLEKKERLISLPLVPKEVSLEPSPRILSFSSLSSGELHSSELEEKGADTLPGGKEMGSMFHRLLEKAVLSSYDPAKIEAAIEKEVQRMRLEKWKEEICKIIHEALHLPLLEEGSFSLVDIPRSQIHVEMEFLYPKEIHFIKGFVDLVFMHRGTYYLLDWKSNWLGPSAEDYTHEKMEQAMHAHDYFLQASLYAEALEKYLKLFDPRPFNECFGGALYVFLRGMKVFRLEKKKSQ